MKRWDLTAHYATAADGALLGFAIVGAEGRGAAAKVFVYELHVAADARRRGVAKALLELAERSAIGRNGPPALELNVHAANADARAAYERLGFAHTSSHERGRVLVMRRKR